MILFFGYIRASQNMSFAGLILTAIAQIPLGSTRRISTRLDTFDSSSLCILAVSSLSNSTARHACLDELDWLDTTSSTGSTRRTCRVVSKRAKWNFSLLQL